MTPAKSNSERVSSQIERGESSKSTGSRSGASLDEDFGVDDGTHNTSGSPMGSVGGVSSHQDGSSQRRHRPRNSGGFLLDSAFTPIKQPDFTQRSTNHERLDIKGKGRSTQDGISTGFKKTAHPRHRAKASLGSSPLASKVTNARVSGEEGAGRARAGSPDKVDLASSGNGLTETLNVGEDTNKNSDPRWSGSLAQSDGASAPPLGRETNAVDIINLALNLSEIRRRTVSVGRLPASSAAGNRRVVSMSIPSPGLLENTSVAGAGGSLRQHLHQQRRVSRIVTPLPGKSQGSPAGDASPFPGGASQGQIGHEATVLLPLPLGHGQDVQYNFSDATLSRAAKARTALELFYEYRRLLQYLPPIRLPPTPTVRHMIPPSSTSSASRSSEEILRLGRRYNPLQYIRNRKLRARNKIPLDGESGGWDSLQRVRDWVDKVADQSAGIVSASNEITVLPGFGIDAQELPRGDDSAPSNASRPTGPKARRQRLDWVMNPADLLADAFWLEQGTNKELIEDRNGNKLFPANLLSKPLKARSVENAVSLHSQLFKDRGGRSQTPLDQEALPNSAGQSPLDISRTERGRSRHQLHVSRQNIHERSASTYTEASRQKGAIRSRTSSGSRKHHGRPAMRRFSDSKKELSDRDSFRGPASGEHRQLLRTEAKDRTGADPGDIEIFQKNPYEGSPVWTSSGSRFTSSSRSNEELRLDKFHRMPNPISVLREHAASTPRASLDSDRPKRPGLFVDDLDMTAPSSPIAPNFVPSIAINLSPPPSRSTSPSKSSLKSKLNLLRPERSKESQSIDGIDFVLGDDLSRKSSRQVSAESDLQGAEATSKLRLLSPTKKRFSNNLNEVLGADARSPDRRNQNDVKEMREPESRLRGIFKGRRIAELVGNEVSRVGDFLWKRDLPKDRSPQWSPASSMASELSDSDVSEALSLGREPQLGSSLSRTSTRAENGKISARKAAGFDQPKYHISNLPTFQSSYKDSEAEPSTHSGAIEDDHITRQQAAQRERGRSSRFDRLAPPRIDVQDASPSPHSRAISPGPVAAQKTNGRLARNARSLSPEQGIRGPKEQANPLLGPPGSIGRRGPPVTGLTSLGVSDGKSSAQRPSLERQRQWSISDRKVATSDKSATKRDIAHIRALLLSSGIKAKEICRRANEVRVPSPRFLQIISDTPLPLVPRAQEHVLASRILIRKIECAHGATEDAKERFADPTVTELHERIRLVDEMIQNQLTPLVRACADDADTCGAELTTTQTLAVKQLNDSVHQIMRGRRRRLKWIRRAGYVLLEWTLLGIMWWAWLVVVIIRLIRGGFAGVVSGVRWMLWL